MKKSLIALAVLAMAGSAFATNTGFATGSSSAGVKSSSVAAAASTGNGTAYTATRGGQYASSTQSASSSLTGSFLTGQAGGKADVNGTTLAGGYAESYTKTTGAGVAGSLSFGEACAQSEGAAAFYNPLTGAQGVVGGASSSVNSNFAGTAAIGNGEAYRGNWSENSGSYSAHADASKKAFTTKDLSANTSAMAENNSYKGLIAPSITNGTAVGIQGNVNFGAAGAFANAQVGNLCSGCGPVVQPPVVVDEDKKPKHRNNGWGNGDQDAPGGSFWHNRAENNNRP